MSIHYKTQNILSYRLWSLFSISTLLWLCAQNAYASVHWQTLTPGIEYTQLTDVQIMPLGKIHVFRIDLALNQLQIGIAEDRQGTTAKTIAKKHNALITTNGGFFSPELKSLGLRIEQGKILSPLHPTPWWGIFYITGNKPYSTDIKNFRFKKEIQFAIQSGPRLIIHDHIPSLKPGLAERTAIGITHLGKIILLVTEQAPLSTRMLAKIMQNSMQNDGLDCMEALNLDGGHSSQVYAKIGDFTLDLPAFSQVADLVYVVNR